MQKFKDSEGREWSVVLSGWQMRKVHERLAHKCRDPQSVLAAADDQALLCDILCVLCDDEIKQRGLTDKQFMESLSGDALDDATEAYMNESIPFVPRQFRTILASCLTKAKEAQEKATEELTNSMDQMIQTTLTEARQKMQSEASLGTNIGSLSGSAQA